MKLSDIKVLYITSIDVGIKNFAHYTERASTKSLVRLNNMYKTLPSKSKRRVKGKMNDDIDNILKKMYKTSKSVNIETHDFCPEEKNPNLTNEIRKSLISYLDDRKNIWKKSHVILIEQQYFSTFTPKGRRNKSSEANVKAIKMGEDTLMWFLINYPDKEIVYFGSMFKTQILGAPDSLSKSQRKKWSVDKTKEIGELREDQVIEVYFLDCKKKKRKADDGADGCTMCQAYKFRTFIGEF